MNKYNVTGDEIVALLGRSESDDKVLDLFEKLEIDRSEIERDEDINTFDIDLREEIGLTLTFDYSLKEEYRIPKYIGGNYLVQVTFDYYFKPLPYTLDDGYNLDKVVEVLGKEPNYISIDDSSSLYWFYEDLGWLSIEFEDESLSSIYYVDVKPYEDPLETWDMDEDGDEDNGFNTIIKPFKR
jgi:hypothetical protein